MAEVAAGARRDNVGRGIALALAATLIFSTQDATSKLLVQSVSPFQLTMMRFWAFAAFSLFLVLRQGSLRTALRTTHPVLQVLRGVLLVVDIWMFVLSLKTVQLPEVQSITLVYPLIVTLAAIPLLGEKIGVFRIGAVVVGFFGALVIVRPGGVPLDWGALAALGSGACYALYIVLTRKVSATDTTSTSMVYVGLVGLVLTSSIGVFFWHPLDLTTTLLIAYIMMTGVVAHGMMMVALALAPASVLQPFSYTSLPWSIVFSIVIFQHMIDPISLAGAGVIVAAGLVVMARERIKKIPAAAEPTLPGRE
ncbi:MAG TPA: DMT family transporter [Devosia sp.]|jgi:drug/metabolite transporter (DMT)-like permease|nr:DMT family transporter [Devosia sp.]